MTEMSTAEVHRTISKKAARIANRLAAERGLVDPDAAPFYESVNRVRGRSLSLEYDQSFLVGRDPQWVKNMNDVGVEAARAVCVIHPDLIVGLAMGNARLGRNYFEHFGESA